VVGPTMRPIGSLGKRKEKKKSQLEIPTAFDCETLKVYSKLDPFFLPERGACTAYGTTVLR
jgi:hypothetical protein